MPPSSFKIFLIFILVSSIFTVASFQNSYATPVFDVEFNISGDGFSAAPQVAVDGTNVYAVWVDATGEIVFDADTGSGFDGPEIISHFTGVAASPQIAVSGGKVYVAWIDFDGAATFFSVRISSDNGATFNDLVTYAGWGDLDGDGLIADILVYPASGSNPTSFSLAASDPNVYLVWKEEDSGTDITIVSTFDNFESGFGVYVENTFTPGGTVFGLDASAAGDNVYVAAQSDSDIVVIRDDGTSSTETTVDVSAPTSSNPQIFAVDGAPDTVHVVWQEGDADDEIFYAQSTDSATTFDAPENLSTNSGHSEDPQIDISGINVHVAWRDNITTGSANQEILYSNSPSGGTTGSFSVPVNLSNTSGPSSLPRVSSSGSNFFVVWQDRTIDDTDGDVFYRPSDDNGATFGGLKILSTTDVTTPEPKVAGSSTGGVSTLWASTGGALDVYYRSGVISDIEVSFDAFEYSLVDTATITVKDPSASGSGPIFVDIESTSGGAPSVLSLSLSEIGSTGVFSGTFTFGTSTSGTILEATTNDILTATYGTQFANAWINENIDVSFDPISILYDRGAVAGIKVTDPSANTDPGVAESITVDITTLADPVGISLALTETDFDSGVFGGSATTDLIFMTEDNTFSVGDSITITQTHTGANTDDTTTQTIDVDVTSSTDPIGITITLTETTPSSGDFSGTLNFISGTSTGNSLQVSDGDIFSVTRLTSTSNGIIVPTIDGRGAILVNPASVGIDTVTVTYSGVSVDAEVSDTYDSGGGGGGLGRAGFVVNVVAGIGTLGGGGSGGNAPPSFGQSSFAIISGGEEGFGGILNDNDKNTLEETKTFKVGEKAVLRFDFTEGGGIGKIEHIGLYTNVRDGQKRQDSDAYIFYDPLKSPKATIHDPNGLFSEANFELLPKDTATTFVLKYDLTFAKPMAKSDLILESWNLQKWSTLNKIPNAIEVISSGLVQQSASEPIVDTFVEDVTNDQVIPVWIKTNADWWSDDTIDNDTFVSGIEYLVNEGIIKVTLPDTTGTPSVSEIQPWIKNTAGWWADDMISDDEFLTAIEWLISNNIIQVV